MTQRLGARSRRLVRPRRGHHLPAGPGKQRLHSDHGLEHGGGAPGRLPLAHESQGRRAPRSSTSIPASRAPRPCATSMSASAPAATSPSSAASSITSSATSAGSRSMSRPTPTPPPSSRKDFKTPKTSRAFLAATTRKRKNMTPPTVTGATKAHPASMKKRERKTVARRASLASMEPRSWGAPPLTARPAPT